MNLQLPLAALLLDLDGVLVDSAAVVERTWHRWAESHGLDPATVLAQAHGRPSAATVRAVAPWLRVEDEVAALLEWELADVDTLTAVPGARELLGQIGPLAWGVVTSGHRELAERRLRAVGLPLPPVLVAGDEVTEGKPHPAPYLEAARLLGAAPRTAVVIEDSPAGVTAGCPAGMAVVALTTTHEAAALGAAAVIVPDLRSSRLHRVSRKEASLEIRDQAT